MPVCREISYLFEMNYLFITTLTQRREDKILQITSEGYFQHDLKNFNRWNTLSVSHNTLATGNTLICDRRFEPADDLNMYEVPMDTFLHYFLVFLKRRLQKYQKILKRCFLVTYSKYSKSRTNDIMTLIGETTFLWRVN